VRTDPSNHQHHYARVFDAVDSCWTCFDPALPSRTVANSRKLWLYFIFASTEGLYQNNAGKGERYGYGLVLSRTRLKSTPHQYNSVMTRSCCVSLAIFFRRHDYPQLCSEVDYPRMFALKPGKKQLQWFLFFCFLVVRPVATSIRLLLLLRLPGLQQQLPPFTP
jgi:hypothetical protein